MTNSLPQYWDNVNNTTPSLSALTAKSVSVQRHNELSNDINKGIFRHGSSQSSSDNGLTLASNMTSSVGQIKNAQVISSGGSSGNFRGSGGTVRQLPEVYSPLWLNSNLSMPRDRNTVNMWCRSFYALNPFVHNAINLHSTYPISKLSIKCHDKDVEDFFSEMIEETQLMNICVQVAQEFWLLGEAFIFGELDEAKGKWKRFVIQNPDHMIVQRVLAGDDGAIFMKPDEKLKRIVTSSHPSDIEQRKQLSSGIVDAVKKGQNIPMPGLQTWHLARKISPYDVRGTGLPVAIFRALMLYDKLRESKFVQADSMINPQTLIKVGNQDFKPTAADLDQVRSVIEQAQYDKDFKIITHDAVSIERIGWGGGILDISNDLTQLTKEIFIGLQVPPVLMDGGGDTTYANGGVQLDVLRQRYMQFRNMMSEWLRRKVFAPISQIQGFYEYKNRGGRSEKKLIIPEVDWNHMSLFDAGDYTNLLMQLSQGEGDQKRVSNHTLYRSLGLEFEDEQRKLKKESIAAEVLKKEKEVLASMNLTELRSLTDDDEIVEKQDLTDQPENKEEDTNLPGVDNSPAPETPVPAMPPLG
jgi:hypothetical protein